MRSCSTKSVSPQVPRIAPGGLIARASRKVPLENGRLRLAPELFANDALCFLDAASTDVAYVNGRGQAIEISVEDFPACRALDETRRALPLHRVLDRP